MKSENVSFSQKVQQRLLAIKDALALDDVRFFDFLGITSSEYQRILSGRAPFSAEHLERFVQRVGINITHLFEDTLDLYVLAKNFQGDALALPERYAINEQKLARVRAVKSIHEFLESYFGRQYANNVLTRLQLSPAHLSDPFGFISPFAFLDLLREMRRDGLTDSHIRTAGLMNSNVNSNTDLGRALTAAGSAQAMYQSLHEIHFVHFDQLFHYKLTKLSKNNCVVEITSRRDSLDRFNLKKMGDRSTCLYKQGVYLSFLSHLPGYTGNIEESECMYSTGGTRCRYHLSWTHSLSRSTSPIVGGAGRRLYRGASFHVQ